MLLQLGVNTKTITLSLAPHTIVFTSALICLTKYIAIAFLNFLIIAPYRIIEGKAAFTWRDTRRDHMRLDTQVAHLVAPEHLHGRCASLHHIQITH